MRSPYDDFDAEMEVWCARPRRWIIPARWELKLLIVPRDRTQFLIPMQIGNEYSGLIYGFTRQRAINKAERYVARQRRDIARRQASEILAPR